MKRVIAIAMTIGALAACASVQRSAGNSASVANQGTIAQIYYWRAKPGKYAEYTRYVHDVAEPIDAEAHRRR